ncbi:MAG: right-handed parallel beta-helix repeat-containing protein [Kiritimatiellae bacterium]|nr:right-handed parallel beta-helix repeat-containing protein [Kiritimatiellia bacterium]
MTTAHVDETGKSRSQPDVAISAKAGWLRALLVLAALHGARAHAFAASGAAPDAGPAAGDRIDWGSVAGPGARRPADGVIRLAEEFNARVAAARPGEVIPVRNGTYRNWKMKVPCHGAVITAETPDGVCFTGFGTKLTVTGNGNVIGGFRFEKIGTAAVTFYGTCRNRLTDCVFESCGDPKSPVNAIIDMNSGVTPTGSISNRIDHCTFRDFQAKAIRIVISERDPEPAPGKTSGYNRIDHNLFTDARLIGGKNGNDALQLGQTWNSTTQKVAVPRATEVNLHTFVEHNEFVRVSNQIVNQKANGTVFRFNRLMDCRGAISQRSGDGCVYEGNYFENSKGLLLRGANHVVVNNIFNRVSGTMLLHAWGRMKEGGGYVLYFPNTNNLVAHNTFVDPQGDVIEIGRVWGAQGDVRNPPCDNRFINNIFVATRGTLIKEAGAHENTIIRNNLFHVSGEAAIGLCGEGAVLGAPALDARFCPNPGSPALNAGSPGTGVGTDFYGRQRDARPDIGAVERR